MAVPSRWSMEIQYVMCQVHIMQREVNLGRPLESRLHVDYDTKI